MSSTGNAARLSLDEITTSSKSIDEINVILVSSLMSRTPVMDYRGTIIDLLGHGRRGFVMKKDNMIAAFALVDWTKKVADIEYLVVRPSLRLSGIGSFLMSTIESIASREGKRRITLGTYIENIGFYRRQGYNVHRRARESGDYFFLQKKIVKNS